jgi:hypothetical protein
LAVVFFTTLSAAALFSYALLARSDFGQALMLKISGRVAAVAASSQADSANFELTELARVSTDLIVPADSTAPSDLQRTSDEEASKPTTANEKKAARKAPARAKAKRPAARPRVKTVRRAPVRATPPTPHRNVSRKASAQAKYGWVPRDVSEVPKTNEAAAKVGDIVRELPSALRPDAIEMPPEYQEDSSGKSNDDGGGAETSGESRGFISVETSAERARELERSWARDKAKLERRK